MISVAIVGTTGCGKSTLFALLTGREYDPAAVHAHGARGVPAVVPVVDRRLEELGHALGKERIIHPLLELFDTLPLVAEAGGTGQLMAALRNMDALVVVVGLFGELEGELEERARREWQRVQTEFIVSDLEVVEKRIERLKVAVRRPTPSQERDRMELGLMQQIRQQLEAGRLIKRSSLSPAQKKLLRSYALLCEKPGIVVFNVSERMLADESLGRMLCKIHPSAWCLCARLELELTQLPEEEKRQFMKEYGLHRLGSEGMLQRIYRALGLQSFFTVGKDEVRAWPIPVGTIAVEAAGKVHSDMARGFIAAEVVAFEDWKRLGGLKQARQQAALYQQGRDYVVCDGDIINFKFNV
jgi:hypothetical protein